MSTFPARYPGRCGACDERIHEGDPIRFAIDSPTNFVHADCEAVAAFVANRPDVICDRCWLAKPCGCDEP